MSTATSGRPYVDVAATSTTALSWFPPVKTQRIQVKNEGAVVVNMYFDSSDVGTTTKAVVLAASGSTGDFLEGPAELFPTDDPSNPTRGGLYFQTASGTANVRIVTYAA